MPTAFANTSTRLKICRSMLNVKTICSVVRRRVYSRSRRKFDLVDGINRRFSQYAQNQRGNEGRSARGRSQDFRRARKAVRVDLEYGESLRFEAHDSKRRSGSSTRDSGVGAYQR